MYVAHRCRALIVKFVGHQNSQRVTLGDGPSFAKHMVVTDTDDRLSVEFRDAANRCVKLISWPVSHIYEITCEECYPFDTVEQP